EIFDTTIESVAKKNNLFDPKLIFKARPVVIGARHVLPGIDKGLEGAELGEKKIMKIPPEDGFGKRDPSKVKLIPMKEFKKKGVRPAPGMHIEIDDTLGRVQRRRRPINLKKRYASSWSFICPTWILKNLKLL
ncbi:MAG: FKBP-type peptidyl-prolyl cis-trans isomerase, partial [Candidatus Hodarchaeales archaeon]